MKRTKSLKVVKTKKPTLSARIKQLESHVNCLHECIQTIMFDIDKIKARAKEEL